MRSMTGQFRHEAASLFESVEEETKRERASYSYAAP